jgi:Reverse transcriptase (RNA-dependent DNA polymerase)
MLSLAIDGLLPSSCQLISQCNSEVRSPGRTVDDEVHRASGGRSEGAPPDPEMAKGGSIGRRPVVGDKAGTPQGAVASPLLANVYLHYVFDLWADIWRKKVARGDIIVVRYADDLVVGFQHRTDAECFLKEFRERLAKFGLELHPDKTRLIEFGRFAARNRKQRGEGSQRPSRSWVLLTSVGSASVTEPSSSGGSRRKSGWSRS